MSEKGSIRPPIMKRAGYTVTLLMAGSFCWIAWISGCDSQPASHSRQRTVGPITPNKSDQHSEETEEKKARKVEQSSNRDTADKKQGSGDKQQETSSRGDQHDSEHRRGHGSGNQKKITRATSPADALEKAKKLYQTSKAHSAAGDHSAAFASTREAWQLVKQFPKDPDCRSFSNSLFRKFAVLAKRANRAHDNTATSSKALIEQ